MAKASKPEDHARAIVAMLLEDENPVGRAYAPRALRDAWLEQKRPIRDFAAGMMWLFEHGYLARLSGEDITLTQEGFDRMGQSTERGGQNVAKPP